MTEWTKHEVVRDVIDAAPASAAKVSYGKGREVNLGNELTPTQVKDPPTVEWTAEAGALYTLIMTDPDAPSRTNAKFREWRHWHVSNISQNDISKGDTLAQYIGSGPPQHTGLHRYIFLIYKQSGRLDTTKEPALGFSGEGRGGFKAREWVATKLGATTPLVAGNFYQAQWDDYVPILYQQLSAGGTSSKQRH